MNYQQKPFVCTSSVNTLRNHTPSLGRNLILRLTYPGNNGGGAVLVRAGVLVRGGVLVR